MSVPRAGRRRLGLQLTSAGGKALAVRPAGVLFIELTPPGRPARPCLRQRRALRSSSGGLVGEPRDDFEKRLPDFDILAMSEVKSGGGPRIVVAVHAGLSAIGQ